MKNRKKLRKQNYDYTQPGNYFITMNTKDRLELFGEIIENKMILNAAGESLMRWYKEIENKYPNVICHEIAILPEHVHFLIEITYKTGKDVPAILQWYKTMTTNEYIRGVKTQSWPPFNKRLWHKSYWEDIIKSPNHLKNVKNYIIHNAEHH